jgi:hypothetical protein
MRGSEREGEQHSTGLRPRPWVRVIGSLALFGFLIGLMVGRILQPEPLWLDRVDVREGGLALWFNVEPQVREEHSAGVYVLRMQSFGREQQGQLSVQGKTANWRLQRQRRDLLLRVLAARPLRGEWRAEQVDGLWRLTISLAEQ